jgi:hypothetical protein
MGSALAVDKLAEDTRVPGPRRLAERGLASWASLLSPTVGSSLPLLTRDLMLDLCSLPPVTLPAAGLGSRRVPSLKGATRRQLSMRAPAS